MRMAAQRWTLALLLVGLGLRCFHYLRAPSVWHDEAALIVNVLDKDFVELLGPLHHHEAAPPLFLWLERAVVATFGDGVYALRLMPFLASCGALLLVAGLARRALPERAVPWAVGFFAVSDRLLWHACEAKPYAVDAFIASAFAYGFVCTQHWSAGRRCLLWLPFAPLAIWLSYPGCFLCGGLVLALLSSVWISRSWRAWINFTMLNLAIGIAFLLLYIGPAKAQRDGAMESCWPTHFPDWSKPADLPRWTVFSTLDLIRYDLMPFGQLLVAPILIGIVVLWKRKQQALATYLVAPLVLVFIASCMRAYPYGGARVIVFTAPAIVLLLVSGLPCTWDWLARRSRLAAGGFAVLLVMPFAHTLHRTTSPWPRADSASAAAFVRVQRQPGDRIACNHWEYEYYFRDTPGILLNVVTPPTDLRPRVWVLFTGGNGPELETLRLHLDLHWSTREWNQFEETVVFLLEPKHQVAAGSQRSNLAVAEESSEP